MAMTLFLTSPICRPISTSFWPSPKPSLPKTPTPTPAPPGIFPATSFPNSLQPPILTVRSLFPSLNPVATPRATTEDYFSLDIEEDFEAAGEDDEESPWEGAVVYRRDPTTMHLEYATTLERLGLGKLSSELSRTRAADMGIRVVLPRRRKEGELVEEESTPVLVSVDVTRKKRKLRLDGIVRTVMTLACNRCAQPATEAVFSNFTLLLTEDPIEETAELNMGTIFGDEKFQSFSSGVDDEDDENNIDLDDRLHFPPEDKEIDISKHIRDIVHLEITINAVCDSGCKGLCLRCGTDLNKSNCNCGREVEQDDGEFGPLKSLKKQMQKR